MIINSDQITVIYIDNTGTKVKARLTQIGDTFELGSYANRDICIKVIEQILVSSIESMMTRFEMPLKEQV